MRGKSITLGGRVVNCGIWIPDDRGGWKCGAYARVCDPPVCAKTPDPKVKQTKVCVKTQLVSSLFYGKPVTRCKKYQTACEGAACLLVPMPYPAEPSERTGGTEEEIQAVAEWLADEAKAEIASKEPYLAREILSRGGIRPMRVPSSLQREGRPKATEEYKAIPLFLRNRTGLPLDEMANEMGYEYENDLTAAIQKAYPPRTKGEWKKKQPLPTWEDYVWDAERHIEEQIEAGLWQ